MTSGPCSGTNPPQNAPFQRRTVARLDLPKWKYFWPLSFVDAKVDDLEREVIAFAAFAVVAFSGVAFVLSSGVALAGVALDASAVDVDFFLLDLRFRAGAMMTVRTRHGSARELRSRHQQKGTEHTLQASRLTRPRWTWTFSCLI